MCSLSTDESWQDRFNWALSANRSASFSQRPLHSSNQEETCSVFLSHDQGLPPCSEEGGEGQCSVAEQSPNPVPSGAFNSACDRTDDCSDETSGAASQSGSCTGIQSSFHYHNWVNHTLKRKFLEILFSSVLISCFCFSKIQASFLPCSWRSASGNLPTVQRRCRSDLERSRLIAGSRCYFLPTLQLPWWILDGETEELSVEELGGKEGEARGKMESDGRSLVFSSARAQGNPVQGAAGSDRPLLGFQGNTATVAVAANEEHVSYYGLYLSIQKACLFKSGNET